MASSVDLTGQEGAGHNHVIEEGIKNEHVSGSLATES